MNYRHVITVGDVMRLLSPLPKDKPVYMGALSPTVGGDEIYCDGVPLRLVYDPSDGGGSHPEKLRLCADFSELVKFVNDNRRGRA